MRRGWWLPAFSERLTGWRPVEEGGQAEWNWNDEAPDVAAGEVGAVAGISGEGAAAAADSLEANTSEAYEGLARRLQGFAPTTAYEVPSFQEAERNLMRASREFAARQRVAVSQVRQAQALSLSDTSLAEATEFCRICRDSAGREALIAPCDCRGTVRFVHKSCLERWLAESDTSFCEICGLRYVTERTPRYSLLKSVFLWAMASRRELLMDVMTFLTFMPLAVLGTTMGMTASRSLCYGLLSEPNDDGVSNLVLLVEPQLGPVAAQTLTAAVVAVMAAMDIAVSTWLVLRVQQHAARCYAWWRRHCVVRLILPPTPTAEEEAARAAAAVESGEASTTAEAEAEAAAETVATCGERALPAPEAQEAVYQRRESTREAPDPEPPPQKSVGSTVSTVEAKVAVAISEAARGGTVSNPQEEAIETVAAEPGVGTTRLKEEIDCSIEDRQSPSSSSRSTESGVRDVMDQCASSLMHPLLPTSRTYHSLSAVPKPVDPMKTLSFESVPSSVAMPPVLCLSEPCSGACTAECSDCTTDSRPPTCRTSASSSSDVSHPSILCDSSEPSIKYSPIRNDTGMNFGHVASHIFSNTLTYKPGTTSLATATTEFSSRPFGSARRQAPDNATVSHGAIPKAHVPPHSEGRSLRSANYNERGSSTGSGSSNVSTTTTVIRIHIPNARPPSQRQRPRSPGF